MCVCVCVYSVWPIYSNCLKVNLFILHIKFPESIFTIHLTKCETRLRHLILTLSKGFHYMDACLQYLAECVVTLRACCSAAEEKKCKDTKHKEIKKTSSSIWEHMCSTWKTFSIYRTLQERYRDTSKHTNAIMVALSFKANTLQYRIFIWFVTWPKTLWEQNKTNVDTRYKWGCILDTVFS